MDKWDRLLAAVVGFIIVYTVIMFIVGRLTPYDPNPCTRHNPTAQNIVDCMKAQPTSTPELTR